MSDRHFIPIAALDSLPEGTTARHRLGGAAILLCRSEGRVFAIAELCSHAHESLACGRIRHGWIACPAHGARFDLLTGEPLSGPATTAIACYDTRVVDGIIEARPAGDAPESAPP